YGLSARLWRAVTDATTKPLSVIQSHHEPSNKPQSSALYHPSYLPSSPPRLWRLWSALVSFFGRCADFTLLVSLVKSFKECVPEFPGRRCGRGWSGICP